MPMTKQETCVDDYLKYNPIAGYKCGYELLLSLKSIFGFEERCTQLYEV